MNRGSPAVTMAAGLRAVRVYLRCFPSRFLCLSSVLSPIVRFAPLWEKDRSATAGISQSGGKCPKCRELPQSAGKQRREPAGEEPGLGRARGSGELGDAQVPESRAVEDQRFMRVVMRSVPVNAEQHHAVVARGHLILH